MWDLKRGPNLKNYPNTPVDGKLLSKQPGQDRHHGGFRWGVWGVGSSHSAGTATSRRIASITTTATTMMMFATTHATGLLL